MKSYYDITKTAGVLRKGMHSPYKCSVKYKKHPH